MRGSRVRVTQAAPLNWAGEPESVGPPACQSDGEHDRPVGMGPGGGDRDVGAYAGNPVRREICGSFPALSALSAH